MTALRILVSSFAVGCVWASTAVAQGYDRKTYCEQLGALSDGQRQIIIPIDTERLAWIYEISGLASDVGSAQFQLMATGVGDLEPHSDWLSNECAGLSLIR